jgi:hypothetical protein
VSRCSPPTPASRLLRLRRCDRYILALVNASGVVTATYTHDPYGNYTTTATGAAAEMNPYRTAGGVYDRGTG